MLQESVIHFWEFNSVGFDWWEGNVQHPDGFALGEAAADAASVPQGLQ